MNIDIIAVIALASELVGLLGMCVPLVASNRKIRNGTRCQLRSEMLRIYYRNREQGKIHQYEAENFAMLYDAYKELKGNSFIDKINDDVRDWEIIP